MTPATCGYSGIVVKGRASQNMKASRSFNVPLVLAQAKSGELRGASLRKAIQIAEEFGIDQVAGELRQRMVEAPKKRATK